MSQFAFQLETLLRYRRYRRDLCRQALAGVLADERRLGEQIAGVRQQRNAQLAELRGLGRGGEVDIDRSASRRYYAGRLLGEIALLERNHRVLSEQLAACRQALTEADQSVRVLERLREKREAEFRYAQQRRDHRERDEQWLAIRLAEAAR